jgi:beta-carotene 15,15'-dioxygenase
MKKMFSVKHLKAEVILLIIGCITILYNSFISEISLNVQTIVLLSLVFTVGVPHGALDFLVDEQNETVQNKTFSLQKFLVTYVTRLVVFALFWFLPWFAFCTFIIFSIFHFGETDMNKFIKPNKNGVVVYFTYGAFILSTLLLSHLPEIKESIPQIDSFLRENNLFDSLQQYRFVIIGIFCLLFVGVLLWQNKKNNIVPVSLKQIILFCCLITILIFLPLTLAFTFYFALWHSILSVRNIFNYFKEFNNSKNFTIICNKSLLFSLLALGGIFVLYYVLKLYMPDMNLMFALLIMLSVLTLPHLTVMHGMYKNYSKSSH